MPQFLNCLALLKKASDWFQDDVEVINIAADGIAAIEQARGLAVNNLFGYTKVDKDEACEEWAIVRVNWRPEPYYVRADVAQVLRACDVLRSNPERVMVKVDDLSDKAIE
jgi:hypothetical protein